MTRDEASKLDMFIAEFREFRIDDRNWKANTDEWRETVSAFVTSEKAIDEKETARGVSRRAYIASTIAAAGVTATVVIGVLNLVTP